LFSNELTTLPDSIGNLPNLRDLALNDNQLTSIPESIGNLNNLTALSLNENQLTILPDSFTNLNNLDSIALTFNHLINLTEEQYNFATSLSVFSIWGQSYSQVIDEHGYVGTEFAFPVLPVHEQFPNFGVTFTFWLSTPDGSFDQISATIVDGKIVIPESYLTEVGDYTLISWGMGANLDATQINHSFSVRAGEPIITLEGENPLIVVQGTTFVEPGFNANDVVDGDLTSEVVVSGTVDTTILGTVTLTYTVENSFGNSATVTREVIVVTDSQYEGEGEPNLPNLPATGNNLLTIALVSIMILIATIFYNYKHLKN
jgi:hypothetical protein